MRILGIDPGTAIVGYGIIDYEKNKYKTIAYGCIYTEKTSEMPCRLKKIYEELNELIKKYKPDFMAVEELFFFKNNKTIISVGQARGVILLCGELNGVKLDSYTPLQVKMGITGYGRAEKKQIQEMVQRVLRLKELPKPDDAADALAIAITHINTLMSSQSKITNNLHKKINIPKEKNKISVEEYRRLLK